MRTRSRSRCGRRSTWRRSPGSTPSSRSGSSRSCRRRASTAARCGSTAVDMRYRRQVHILTSPFVGAEVTADSLEQTVDMFERLYEEKYGRSPPTARRASSSSASRSRHRRRQHEFHVEELASTTPQRRSSSASRRGWTSRASSRRCRATTSSACAPGTRFRAQPSSGRRSRHWSSRPPRPRVSTSTATSSSR